MRFLMLELPGEPALQLRLDRQMTVVTASGDTERDRIARALAGLSEGVLWAADGDGQPIGQLTAAALAKLGIDPEMAAGIVLRAVDLLDTEDGDPVEDGDRAETGDAAEPGHREDSGDLAEDRDLTERRAHLEARRQALAVRRAAREAVSFHPSTVQATLDALGAAEQQASRQTGQACELAQQWKAMTSLLSDLPALRGNERVRLQTAQATLDAARHELEALKAHDVGSLGPEEMAALDQLHAEVDRAQARAARPFPGQDARRRLAEVEAAEAAFLTQFGFSSYTAYLLDRIDVPIGVERPGLAAAEAALAEAQARWDDLEGLADQIRRREELETEAARLRAATADVVGEPLTREPEELLADWPASAPALIAARRRLEATLAGAGVDPGPAPAATASAWLATEREQDSAAAAELAEIEAELAALAPTPQPSPPAPQRAGGHLRPKIVAPGADQLEMHLLGRLAAHRRVGGVGSLPLVLDDALAGVPGPALERALALLERMSSAVQVIYLTTAPDVVAWAGRQAKGRIEVTRLLPAADASPVIHLSAEPATVEPATVEPTTVEPTTVEPTTIEPTTIESTVEPAAVEPAAIETAIEPAAVEPAAVEPAAARLPLCVECWHPLAGDDCSRCNRRFCDQHLVRLSKRPQLCVSCAVVAAGVRPGRR